MSEPALFCRKLYPSTSQDGDHPRENVDAELSPSTADAVLEFSVSVLLHLVTLFCNTFLLTGCCSLTVFSGLQAVFLRRSIIAVILTSKLDHFFTRASWAATLILSTITLFLITNRIECVTTCAQAFQRSDQTARCALRRTFRVDV